MKKVISVILIIVVLLFIAGLTNLLVISKTDPRSLFYMLMKKGIIHPDCALLEKAWILDKKKDEWVKGKTMEYIKRRLPCIRNVRELSEAEQNYFGPPEKYGVNDIYILSTSTHVNYGWGIMLKGNRGVGIRLFKG